MLPLRHQRHPGPPCALGRALRESADKGLTRIELTYRVDSMEGESEIFDEVFTEQASVDLTSAYLALQKVSGSGWHLPL